VTILATGLRRTQEVQYAAGSTVNVLTCQAVVDSVVTAPTGTPTVSIYRPGQETATVSLGATTVDATTQVMSYALTATDIAIYPLGEGYRAEFLFVVSGITHKRVVMFDVVRTPIIHHCPVNWNHLLGVHAEFEGALTQLNKTEGAVARDIIAPAWNDCLAEVEAQGWRPSLLSSPDVFFVACRYMALENLARFLMRSPNELRSKLLEDFKEKAATSMKKVQLRYNDGDSFSQSKVRAFNQPRFLIGPDIWGSR
jgi:hypothetical protein